jgi:AraC family transcriptional regulator
LQICGDLEQQLSLASLALAVGVHPVHVARSFRRFLGYTFGDHLAKIRIRKAFSLLVNSRTPIVDVAYACGFADHAHLCRAFKRSTGLTPSAFRRMSSCHCKLRDKYFGQVNTVQETAFPVRL